MVETENIVVVGTVCFECKAFYAATQQGKKGDSIICPHCGVEGERAKDG